MNFRDLKLSPRILENLDAADYTAPTPIQELAIPPALAGRDVLGTAQTGTGKTAAFSLPLLQRLSGHRATRRATRLRALVLTPTRELAAQIGDSLHTYGRGLGLTHTVVVGGVNIRPQIAALGDGVDILIATPGRLLDLLERRALTLQHVQALVLDEADRMLDMGFLPAVRQLLRRLPRRRQTLFFSATMPPKIRHLTAEILREPAVVSAAPDSAPADAVDQAVYLVDRVRKRHLLIHLLADERITRALVFTRTKHGANRLTRQLGAAGIDAAAIHGNKSQRARVRALDAFRGGSLRVLIATDVASRGIDVEAVSHVINFDLPNVPETYIHRIGRTGRAGRSGVALSLCDADERLYLRDIERLLGNDIERVLDHPFPPTRSPAPEAPTASDKSRNNPKRSARRRGRRSPRRRGRGARVTR